MRGAEGGRGVGGHLGKELRRKKVKQSKECARVKEEERVQVKKSGRKG